MKPRADGRYQKTKMVEGIKRFGYGATPELAQRDLERKLQPTHSMPIGGTLHDIAKAYWYPGLDQLKPLTKRRYTDLYKLHIGAFVSEPNIDRGKVQEWVNSLSRRLAPSTVALTYGLFKQIASIALDEGLLERDPCRRIKLPPRKAKRERTMPVDQAVELLQAVKKTPLSAPVFLASVLGLRRGEICGLKWRDLDRVQKTLTIREQRQNLKKYGGIKDAPPKGNKVRVLHITAQIVAEIDSRGNLDSLYVCCYKKKPWDPERLTRYYEQHRDELNLPPEWTLHDLRHLAGGLLNAAGVPLTGIAAVLGHTTTAMSERYVSHGDDLKRADMEALSKMVFSVDSRAP